MSNHAILAAAAHLGASAAPSASGPGGSATRPAWNVEVVGWAILIGATLMALVLLALTRVWSVRRISGPLRVQPGRPIWPLLVVAFATGIVWVGAQVVYGFYKAAQIIREHGPQTRPNLEAMLTPADWAVVAVVPGVIGFVALWVGDRTTGRWTAAWLGLTGGRRFVRGVVAGLLGTLIVLPLMYWVGALLELVYRALRYEHPKEHDLLKVMAEAPSPLLKWALIAAAVLVAPFFEEYFFRGHFQTLLREGFLHLSRRRRQPPVMDWYAAPPLPAVAGQPFGWPPAPPAGASPVMQPMGAYAVMPPPAAFPPGPLGYASLPPPLFPPPATIPPSQAPPDPPPVPERPAVWQAVLAIVITSVFFSLVHPIWTWPAIFVLSLFLGYAYERTGNLWTCIVMHALFNGFSTVLYLNLPH